MDLQETPELIKNNMLPNHIFPLTNNYNIIQSNLSKVIGAELEQTTSNQLLKDTQNTKHK